MLGQEVLLKGVVVSENENGEVMVQLRNGQGVYTRAELCEAVDAPSNYNATEGEQSPAEEKVDEPKADEVSEEAPKADEPNPVVDEAKTDETEEVK